LLDRWIPLLRDEDEGHISHDNKPWTYGNNVELLESSESADVIIMRKIRGYVTEEWDALYEADACASLVEVMLLSGKFSALVIDDLLKTVIFPKLKSVVESWIATTNNLSNDRDSLSVTSSIIKSNPASRADLYLHPWLPFLSHELSSLFSCVRKRLLTLVGDEDVEGEEDDDYDDKLLVKIVQSWIVLFDHKSLEQFSTQVSMKLSVIMQTSLKINPANQSLDVISNVLLWSSALLPSIHLKCLFRGEFFPLWYEVLFDWLKNSDASANRDILKWYKGWKSYLCKNEDVALLIQGDFGFALEMMMVCRDRQANHSDLPAKASFRSSYMTLLKTESLQASSSTSSGHNSSSSSQSQPQMNQPRSQFQSSSSSSSASNPSSFKEVVAAVAESRGMEFCIKIGRQHSGRQLYSLGRHTIYFDSDVVHVDRNGMFVPVDLEELCPPTS
jgi:hypothetical protein